MIFEEPPNMSQLPNLSLARQIVLTMTPVIPSVVSFLGSATILYSFGRQWKKRISGIKYRLLAAICISDLVNSTCFALWSLPMPAGTPGVWGAFGNRATCDFQGMVMHLGNVGAAYNGALAFYFLLSLCYNQSDNTISKKYEVYMHIWGLAWPVATGVASLFLKLFNYTAVGCWIGSYPYMCNLDQNVPCTRGEDASMYAYMFTGGPLAVTNGAIVYCMAITYRRVKETYENAQRPIRQQSAQGFVLEQFRVEVEERYSDLIRQTGIQALLYSSAYFVTHLWAFLCTTYEYYVGPAYFWMVFLHLLFWPCQGFFNVFIFLRPTIATIRRNDTHISFYRAAFVAAFRAEDIENV